MGYICQQGNLPLFIFYESVRNHKPVWMLESMRNMNTFYWEEDSEQQTYSPSEALLYAIVHDHRVYARYLLNQFSDCALAMPGKTCCRCPSSTPHLAEAVRYGRRDIMELILQVAHRIPTYINRRGCNHMVDGKTPLHLACELSDPEAVTLLLGNGASPQIEDYNEMTPLDLILKQLCTSTVNTGTKMLCLERLLMFMPEVRFKMKSSLKDDPQYWSEVLGEDNFSYLVGKNPAALFLMSMQRILSQLPPHEFTKSLDQLPIPTSLKPLTLPSTQS